MTELDLDDLLENIAGKISTELAVNPAVTEVDPLVLSAIPRDERTWHKAQEVVALFVDLRRSTQLGAGKYAATTAAFYEAAISSLATTLSKFEADYVQIQGDGAFALFWGALAHERALCAGITVRTFSETDLVPGLQKKWDEADTGFRVGVASGRILVKNISDDEDGQTSELVWTGKPVNYASKAAHAVDPAHQVVVAGSVWDAIKENDYLTVSCGCGGGNASTPSGLWKDHEIGNLQEGDAAEAAGRRLEAAWCSTHGADFCSAILAGKTVREDVAEIRHQVLKSQQQIALRAKAESERENRRNLALAQGRR